MDVLSQEEINALLNGGGSGNSGSSAGSASSRVAGNDDKLSDDEKDAIEATYPALEKISVDYGIMENAEGVYCIPADFGWNDVGAWDSLDNVFEKDVDGNITAGEQANDKNRRLKGSSNSVIFDTAGDKLIAAVGLEDIVIVNTKDAILVCKKDKAQDVKKVVDALNEQGREELL